MKNITAFKVYPSLPDNLKPLESIVYNLMWAWNHDMIAMYLRLDRDLWESTNHNPILMLGTIEQEKLEQLSQNDSFVDHVERSKNQIDEYMQAETWFHKEYNNKNNTRIAYFSAEYGITECMEIYSGGLGILAGDHLKSASDLGIPLVGVGLLYQEGYFRQYLNIDGWQQELYPKNDFYNMPIKTVTTPDGTPLKIGIDLPGREVKVQVWIVQVGRVPLYLLDTNIPENSKEDRNITHQLYGGDREMRIKQEIVLGIGGLRVLEAMGIVPDVCHMNEGHAAFLAFERLKYFIQKYNLKVDEALAVVKSGCVFTTHTPVPAGIDTFEPKLMTKYFQSFAEKIGISMKDLLTLGRFDANNQNEDFNMAILALRLSSFCNGVSKLHGEITRKMWQNVWPGLPEDEIPITSITNGVHARSWISHDMAGLFDRYLGTEWYKNPSDQTIWKNIGQIPPEELWRTHERRRERFTSYARTKLAQQLAQRGASQFHIETAYEVLDPSALTIGFGRRFAQYKRASLILKDRERLKKILCNKKNPVQIIFAGKAHPKDEEGKQLIRDIIHFSRDAEVRRRIVFLEDYDLIIARYMVTGVDVWLNTPRRPKEASGTSGMKAMFNGVLNCSIIDGWWAEAYNLGEDVGWTIGKGEDYENPEYQDQVESNALYNLLEKEIVPLFYERGADGIPWGWIKKMKQTMRSLAPVFNTNRMVREYTERFYLPTAERFKKFVGNYFRKAKDYRLIQKKIASHWSELNILQVEAPRTRGKDVIYVNSELTIQALVDLGSFNQNEVDVQIYFGKLDPNRNIVNGQTVSMRFEGKEGTFSRFAGFIKSASSGLHGYTIRIVPKYEDMVNPFEWHLIHWQ